MDSLDAYPIAVQVENCSRLPLPFEAGSYAVPRGKKKGANTVYIEESNANVQTVLVCFPRVTYQPGKAPLFYHQDSWFYHYVPEFSSANRIHKRRFPMAIGLPSGFFIVTEKDFESSVLSILQNKTAYGIDEMIVSANKAFSDGEYEASLVILEAIFEAKVKGCIRRYYASLPAKNERERKQRIGDAIGNKPITRLLVEEYPKCEDFQRFCEGVPAYDKWNRMYKMRNDFSHELQKLEKGAAVTMFEEFDEVCQYLFGLKTNYR